MNLFRRTPQVDTSDPQVPLEVTERVDNTPAQTVEWEPKPADLTGFRLDKATIQQPVRHWETLTPAVLHWSDSPPPTAGLWWYRVHGVTRTVRQCVVVMYGTTLCVKSRAGDAVRYTSVAVLERSWCGPIATPPDVALDELELVA